MLVVFPRRSPTADPAMNRRCFLGLAAGAAALASGFDFTLREGLRNACYPVSTLELASHPLVAAAWHGLDATKVWDAHCHLFGNGDSGGGLWFNPAMAKLGHPTLFVQRLFYLNGACVDDTPGRVDTSIVARLEDQLDAMPAGVSAILLAFDWFHDESGAPVRERSAFYVPDARAAAVAKARPDRFQWAASIHPYARDAVGRLEAATADGARAVKWLPSAQGIDPGSPRCDAFYRALARLRMPLLSHGGAEHAAKGANLEQLNNPLRLRRPLDAGVRVIVAHCASLGTGRDLDRGPNGPEVANFALFARVFDDAAYSDRIYADISAVTLANRDPGVIETLLARTDWHARLLNGSDYPLPGIPPLVSLNAFVARGLLEPPAVPVLRAIRDHSALLFDLVLKRSLARNGARLSASVFETRPFFAGA
jgi:predicted TIM-barrel fold metal-dependent hydrolase